MLKGALVVGQSGGPTPVINASLAGVVLAVRRYSEITGVYGLVHGIEGALKEDLIDLGQESAELQGTAQGFMPPQAARPGLRADFRAIPGAQCAPLCLHRRQRLHGYLPPHLGSGRVHRL